MKTVTITAMMALLVAIPFILGRKRLQLLRQKSHEGQTIPLNDNQRYDIEDFLT